MVKLVVTYGNREKHNYLRKHTIDLVVDVSESVKLSNFHLLPSDFFFSSLRTNNTGDASLSLIEAQKVPVDANYINGDSLQFQTEDDLCLLSFEISNNSFVPFQISFLSLTCPVLALPSGSSSVSPDILSDPSAVQRFCGNFRLTLASQSVRKSVSLPSLLSFLLFD